MGLCASSSLSPEQEAKIAKEKALSSKLDKKLQAGYKDDEQIKKLLLLGAGESGKSTLFKQINTIYGKGFQEKDRDEFVVIIHNNVIKSMKMLTEMTEKFAEGLKIECKDDLAALQKRFEGPDHREAGEGLVDAKLAGHIGNLWKDEAVRKTFENRALFQLEDSANYYFDKIDVISQPDWKPSDMDILCARVRTTGIIENDFTISQSQFKMFDVGGQRNERKKWLHCFQGVTAVLFVGVLSEYNLVLYEDDTQNRFVETLELFQNTINSEWFTKTAIILFLNKCDLFREKIQQHRLSDCPVFRVKKYDLTNRGKYPESEWGTEYTEKEILQSNPDIDNYEGGCKAIEKKFLERRSNQEKLTYTHITCATDRGNISHVFEAVKDIIINHALDEAGLC